MPPADRLRLLLPRLVVAMVAMGRGGGGGEKERDESRSDDSKSDMAVAAVYSHIDNCPPEA